MEFKEQMLIVEIGKIRKEIERYDYFYYTDSNPIISDKEYDELIKKLEMLQIEYKKITGQELEMAVGSSLKDTKFQKVKHQKPMLSLGNSYNIEDVIAFVERIKKEIKFEDNTLNFLPEKDKTVLQFDLELKLDGLSISVIYEKGKLVRAVTRGDGVVGEDVTENVLAIKSIPKYLNEDLDLEIRGEIIIPLSQFEKINQERLENGEEIFANPRNAAAGTLRQIDSEVVARRNLDAYFYFLVDAEKYNIYSHKESLEFIKKLGIKTSDIFESFMIDFENKLEKDLVYNNDAKEQDKGIKKLEERIKFWEFEKEKLDYETDGLVIKLDSIKLWDELGNTSKAPKWAIAYKFPAKQMTTKLLGITWQVGRTGKVTPVAELKEVFLSGSNVKRASLHNYDEILRKNIKIGDTVFIEKAAEIIPQVVKSVPEMRDGSEKEIVAPTHCPSCETQLIKEDGNVDLKCPNDSCPEKIRCGIDYFVSRDGMNITGLGTKIVERLIGAQYLKDISDIYLLKNHKDELMKMDKMGEKSVENLLNSIEVSKTKDFDKTLYSLGIPFVGKFLAKSLAKNTKNIDALASMSIEELKNIEGVGEKGAIAIYDFFRDEKSIEIIKKLREYGVNFSLKENEKIDSENINSEIYGKSFLFTGKLTLFTREIAQKKVEEKGGIISGSVNKKLDYLIVGEDAGSKLEKAKKLETVKILTEQEFLSLLEEK